MAKISKKPALGINEEERKKRLAEVGYDLRKNIQSGGFHTVKKRQAKKTKNRKLAPLRDLLLPKLMSGRIRMQ
jgi:hypothetical protein